MPNPIIKSPGSTDSEKYLNYLCHKSFLSLWSYPNIFHKPGKEVCDLLVVFGDDIIIFSDKYCEFKDSGNLESDWLKWFRRAIENSVQQLWGAERIIKSFPNKLYLDSKCKNKIPININITENTRFHLISVAHGGSKKCKEVFKGGSGSFITKSDTRGFKNHTEPFVIGDFDTSKTYAHVLDDTTLDVLLKNLDTVDDFIKYLNKKEILFRSKRVIITTGEEELLAYYLENANPEGEHDFAFPSNSDNILLPEGGWQSFQKKPARIAQLKENKISYLWDGLIEQFSKHALEGTQYANVGGLEGVEKTLRFMAKESRFRRRILANFFFEALGRSRPNQRFLRVSTSLDGDTSPTYVLLFFPVLPIFKTEKHYREVRINFLHACMLVTRLKYPKSTDIIGIATESGIANPGRSEDAMYINGREWSKKDEKHAKQLQEKFEILVSPTETKVHHNEYPQTKKDLGKNPRNKPCICNSGLKYKKCCGKGK